MNQIIDRGFLFFSLAELFFDARGGSAQGAFYIDIVLARLANSCTSSFAISSSAE